MLGNGDSGGICKSQAATAVLEPLRRNVCSLGDSGVGMALGRG